MLDIKLRRALCALATFCTFASAASAQGTATIAGTVVDTAGTPLPNVQVVVDELNRTTTTAGNGTFSFRSLRSGTYHLDATLIGHAPAHATVTAPATGGEVQVTIIMRPTPLALAEIQVTASPTSADPLEITQSTLELSGKALGRNLAASVAQTLAASPGISTRYAGPSASAPVIRGLQGDRILILQDGERAGDLSSSSPDHGVSIDPLNAQRIEVVRGPASLLYGNNALGGVVNVISNDIPNLVPTHLEGFAALQAESVNPGGAATGGATLPLASKWALNARLGGRRIEDVRIGGGGHLPNTDAQNLYGVLGLGYVGDRLTGGVAYRGFDFEYGLPIVVADGEAIRLDGRRHQVAGRAEWNAVGGGFTTVRLDGTGQWYRHDEIEPSGEIGTRFDLRTQTANLTARTRIGRTEGAVGLSGLFRQYEPTGEEALTPAANSSTGGGFVYQEIRLWDGPVSDGGEDRRALLLQLGGRFDLYRIRSQDSDAFGPARTCDFRNVSGSAGVSIPFGKQVSLGASLARAFRAPTVEELFSNGFHIAAGTFDVGNPDLEAETSRGVEAVLRAQGSRITMQAAAFLNQIGDYIFPQAAGTTEIEEDDETFQVPLLEYTQRDATLRGLEGQAEVEVSPHWVLGAMGDLVRGTFDDGGPLPFIPAARLGGSARWDDGRYSVGVEFRHAFGQDRAEERRVASEYATDPYTLLDLSAGFNRIIGARVHALTLRVDNLLDVEYRDATSRIKEYAPNPGRNLALVYRVLF